MRRILRRSPINLQHRTDSPQPAATQAQPSPSPAASPPRVIKVIGDLELDDIVEVNIANLEKWAKDNDVTKLVPYISGRAIKGNYPDELHVERGRVIYHLEITPDNKEVWIDLLGEPSSIRRPVTLSVGLEDGSAFDSVHEEGNPVTLTVISPVYGHYCVTSDRGHLGISTLAGHAIPTSFENLVHRQLQGKDGRTILVVLRWRSGFS